MSEQPMLDATPRLSASEVASLLEEQGYAYLDVRTTTEFALGHPAGAYNIPWQVPAEAGLAENPAFLAVVTASFGRDAALVIGCQSGNRSRAASALLREHGFARVVELRPGFGGAKDAFGRVVERGWQALGLPIASEAEPGRDYDALTRNAQSVGASAPPVAST